ncbi:MAG: hypothetical protein QOI24_2265 [Acidobacteriota bacterium]|jgi:hypothetical protein|nr:hypothetical protein [Acidobacteriota bacterium]
MADPKDELIHKVQIQDIEKPENNELDDSQLDKVSGGGSYGYDPGNGS